MTGTLRIVERAFHPAQVHRALADQLPNAVMVRTEIPWLSHGLVDTWRQMGTVVIGVNDPYQPVNCRLLEDWGCHFVLEEPDPEQAAAILLATRSTNTCHTTPKSPMVVAVGGPRGAPGRTEVAVGLAWLGARSGACLLIEADPSPTLGLRLGLAPPSRYQEPITTHGIDVLLGGIGETFGGMIHGGWSRLWDYQTVVVDLGPGHRSFENWPGERVVVCEASPSGIVRAAALLARLGGGSLPRTVVNRLRVDQGLGKEFSLHLAAWTGRQPDALIGVHDDLQWRSPPPTSFQTALEPLMAQLTNAAGESAGGLVTAQHVQVTDGHKVRVEHLGQAFGSRGVDQIHKKTVAPRLGGGAGFDPGQVGAAGG